MEKNKHRTQKKRTGKAYIVLMVVFMTCVMTFQLALLYKRSEVYAARESQLEEELRQEKEKRQELRDYEQYTKTEEYTRNTAKSKLGLVSPNEIIFRER